MKHTLVLLLIGLLASTTLSTRPTAAETAGQDLYLEVFINDEPTNLITRFTLLHHGALSADVIELRNTGINPGSAPTRGEVRLERRPGLEWRIDAASQQIFFDLDSGARAARIISAGPQQSEDETPPQVDTGLGLVLNYDLSLATDLASRDRGGSQAAGYLDARFFTPLGSLNHAIALTGANGGHLRERRLDTYWRSTFAGSAVELQLGDLASAGPSWARPVRLGGVSLRRNFALRPDLVRFPLPSFEGSAALPSTVEVYADGIRRFAADVPAGPFALTDLPFPVGTTDAQIVLRDITGRETRMDLPFLVSDALLRPGTLDYAFAIGQPRLGAGTADDRYLDETYATASLRYGLTDAITLSAHTELGEGLTLAGFGGTFRLGARGTVSGTFGQSRSDSGTGQLAEIGAEIDLASFRFQGRTAISNGRFEDIASVSSDPGISGMSLARPESLNQLSVSMPFGASDRGQLSLFLTDIDRSGDGRDQSLGLSYTQPILKEGTLFVSALALRGEQSDNLLRFGISLPLGKQSRATVSSDARNSDARLTASASGQTAMSSDAWRWRAGASLGQGATAQAMITRDTAVGSVELSARKSSASQNVGVRLEGALVAAGGGVFLSRRIDDAFAVVDAGVPDVAVSSENRMIGRTGRGGRLLVPGLRSYDRNSLAIDPMSLPLDADIQRTSQVVRPAHRSGVRVDFGVEIQADNAIIELVTEDGQPVPVGLPVTINTQAEVGLTGYDGLVYAKGLEANNRITVSLPDGTTCTADAAFRDIPDQIEVLRGVVCR